MSNLETLITLGIPKTTAKFALIEFNNHLESACDWAFSLEGQSWTPQSLNSSSHSAPPIQDQPPPTRFTNNSIPPRHKLILLGSTRVAIVLKEDQGSDRTVEGVVGEVLTKGDHPRGVKVRLLDGRVGRVVGIVQK